MQLKLHDKPKLIHKKLKNKDEWDFQNVVSPSALHKPRWFLKARKTEGSWLLHFHLWNSIALDKIQMFALAGTRREAFDKLREQYNEYSRILTSIKIKCPTSKH